ncbi:hypothetical protein [Robiginitalea aurantiaca]|uniref:Uncharacterized protein n=1 Tax=Robiginitalea aurantiaca TaxID=3056915 RepID=A0ABT7WIK4_9FLAO|nr:hypothetical protein [Robiginitalea aurantiaca]MDM9632664.1 hypothetical protein [Robiginitalea aurantiaca]
MLRFFRQIRQRLLTDNKFSKYLLYAVGEILLVVIGILIALQVDNWNENRKALAQENELLEEVQEGLISDLNLINLCISDHEQFIRSQDFIVQWIDQKLPYRDSLIPHFKHTFWTKLFSVKDAPYETLKVFGIQNLSNKELGHQISNLYDVVYEDLFYWQNEQKNNSLHFRNTHDQIGFEFLPDFGDGSLQLDLRPVNPKALQYNKAYLLNLKMTRGTLSIFNMQLKEARSQIKRTIEMIESELSAI